MSRRLPGWRRGATIATVVALLAPALLPAQSTDPDLAAGLRQVSEGDFEGAIATLDAAARRLAVDPRRKAEVLEAYVHLGVALVALDQRGAARERFRLALGLDPQLTLRPDRHSPKVIAVFEEARREAEAANRTTSANAGKPQRGGGASKAALIILGAGGAAAGGIALARRSPTSGGPPATLVSFTGARFGTPVLGCPNGAVNLLLPLNILVDAVGGSAPTSIGAVTAVLIVVDSPAGPGEVGFASNAPATVSPATVPAGASTTLRVDTTLLCSNGAGDDARYNEWTGRLTLPTSAGVYTLETADRLRVIIP
jgi:hypothetical protein